MKRIIILLMMSTATCLVIPSCSQAEKENVEYFCPMHPEVVQDSPGLCPKCNMDLEKRDKVK